MRERRGCVGGEIWREEGGEDGVDAGEDREQEQTEGRVLVVGS